MLHLIKKIAKVEGNQKIEMLKKYPELKRVLRYAYDSRKKYPIIRSDSDGSLRGSPLNNRSFEFLDELSSKVLSGYCANVVIDAHIRQLSVDDAELYRRLLAKDLQCGIDVHAIITAFPGLIPVG